MTVLRQYRTWSGTTRRLGAAVAAAAAIALGGAIVGFAGPGEPAGSPVAIDPMIPEVGPANGWQSGGSAD